MGFPYSFPEKILRQPPLPHRRSTANEKAAEEERIKGQQMGYCLRRCKRRKSLIMNMESSLSFLPDELWFQILAYLPAEDIYDLSRLVCWKWYRMIYNHTFIHTNLQNTPYGLLFSCSNLESPKTFAYLLTLKQGRIETSKLSDAFAPKCWNTCNGLLVACSLKNYRSIMFYIANPITGQVFSLPPTPARPCLTWLCSIGYTSVSMEYKVVVTSPTYTSQWVIITPGVDSSWRVIRKDHISLPRIMMCNPLITEGFMHWTFGGIRDGRKFGNQVLSLDVETEILTKSCVPLNYDGEYDHWNYLSTGRYLTLLITYGECLWQVWEMKSENGGGEWRKLDGVIIDLGTQMFQQFGFELVPVGWLKYLEVLVLRAISRAPYQVHNFLYNLLTKETNLLELPIQCEPSNPVVHKNSLVWLAGC
ncbi:hypothetical protein CASFOL_034819 [Castilleja foliolosa]|uniref:F-box domain-containing protein n=1 Tax=Castilleja foliolosa TaxID=1961234 RepID=A0ABD3BT78_9LAMI